MQRIYMQSDEQFDVFTTVFSPQICRSRVRTQPADEDQVVATSNYEAHCPEDLDLSQGDVIQVLFKEDLLRWFGRLPSGHQGYFPPACVTTRGPNGELGKSTPSLLRRGSVPVVMATPASPCHHTSAANGLGKPRLSRKNSIRCALDSTTLGGSPSLLHRVLSRSRRKSCPHLPHGSSETGSLNSAYLPE